MVVYDEQTIFTHRIFELTSRSLRISFANRFSPQRQIELPLMAIFLPVEIGVGTPGLLLSFRILAVIFVLPATHFLIRAIREMSDADFDIAAFLFFLASIYLFLGFIMRTPARFMRLNIGSRKLIVWEVAKNSGSFNDFSRAVADALRG
jgi:hypothetical protein